MVQPESLIVEAGRATLWGEQLVRIRFAWSEGEELKAPTWTGEITRVLMAHGTRVVEGDVLLSIDGVDRVAAAVDQPFWRSLMPSDQGSDVAQLQTFLTRLGHYSDEVDGIYGRSTAEAVRLFAVELGVEKPGDVFDQGWVVWLPNKEFNIDLVQVEPATTPPGLGEPIALSSPLLVAATSKSHSSMPLPSQVRTSSQQG